MKDDRTWSTKVKKAGVTVLLALCAAFGLQMLNVASAFANAANPDPTTMGTFTVNPNGTVTADLNGTWTFVNQDCAGRYGQGFAIDWWGISSSPTPNPNFTLTNATTVSAPGQVTRASVTATGSIQIGHTSSYFHVGTRYAGESVNSPTTCTDVGKNSVGSWSAEATYPSQASIPPAVCVNMYDDHGKEGTPSNSANDYSPTGDHDNSIQTNAFDPTMGNGYCVALQPSGQTIQGEIYACVNGSPSTTLVSGGTIAVPSASLSSANPLAPSQVDAGMYTMNATAPSGQLFVACGQSGVTITSATSANQAVTVPAGGAGDGKFYVNAVPVSQTIQGEIYACVNGSPSTTLVSGGTIAVPSAGLSSANPLAPSQVSAGSYTMNATAPSGQQFVACGQSGVTITAPSSASQSVTVPSGGSGDGKFYVAAVTPPGTGYLEVCKSNANSVSGTFRFYISALHKTINVPAGACSRPIKVPSGNVLVEEQTHANYLFAGVSANPADRVVNIDPTRHNITVRVVTGGIAKEVIVTFVNKHDTGTVKVCQVAGSGVAIGTAFTFTNSATGDTTTVPAGHGPGGYCAVIGTFWQGYTGTITQQIPTGDTVSAIKVRPAARLVGTPDPANGKVTVKIGPGVTEITYTDTRP